MKAITITAYLFAFCLLPLLASPHASAAGVTTAAEAIDLAAEHRSLSQQMMKNYILSGLGVRSRKADQALQAAMARFEAQHDELLGYVESTAIRERITQLMQSWQKLKPVYEQQPDKSRVLELYHANGLLLQQADELVLALQQASGSRAGPLLDLAARQRVLCLRLSGLYGMMAWGFESLARPRYLEVYSEITGNLTSLEASADNTPLIVHNLGELRQQLQRTRLTAQASSDTYVPGLVDRSVEKMLKHVDELQGEYLILARSLDG